MSKKIVSERKKWKLEGEESEEWPPRMNYPWSKLQLNEANKDNNSSHNNCNDDNSYNVSNSSNVSNGALRFWHERNSTCFHFCRRQLLEWFSRRQKINNLLRKFKRKWKFFLFWAPSISFEKREKKLAPESFASFVRRRQSIATDSFRKVPFFASERNPVWSLKT